MKSSKWSVLLLLVLYLTAFLLELYAFHGLHWQRTHPFYQGLSFLKFNSLFVLILHFCAASKILFFPLLFRLSFFISLVLFPGGMLLKYLGYSSFGRLTPLGGGLFLLTLLLLIFWNTIKRGRR